MVMRTSETLAVVPGAGDSQAVDVGTVPPGASLAQRTLQERAMDKHSDTQPLSRTEPSGDDAAVLRTIERLLEATARKEADSVVALFGERPVRFDLAPPLQQSTERSRHRAELEAWFDTWEGPLELKLTQHKTRVRGDLALVHGLLWLSGTKRGRERNGLWLRTTWALERQGGAWTVVHEHQSVPFAMDGSYRALVDLQPDGG
jgi:PhnB protein